jgi:hypothetical protein
MPNKFENSSQEELSLWLDTNLGNVDFGCWIAMDLSPVGLIVCRVVNPQNVFVSFWYVSKQIDGIDVAGKLLKSVEEWSKSKGIHKLIGETVRLQNTKAFLRKYNIKVDKILISKEIL